uniref:Uncharacterized protein n=1 Tax=Anguilla anguilla TaxID=7936 RepID=A0A0E9RLQ7_ANGAN
MSESIKPHPQKQGLCSKTEIIGRGLSLVSSAQIHTFSPTRLAIIFGLGWVCMVRVSFQQKRLPNRTWIL